MAHKKKPVRCFWRAAGYMLCAFCCFVGMVSGPSKTVVPLLIATFGLVGVAVWQLLRGIREDVKYHEMRQRELSLRGVFLWSEQGFCGAQGEPVPGACQGHRPAYSP